MKKTFKTPEVSSVELSLEDVIMDSVNITDKGVDGLSAWTDKAAGEFGMWKGLNK